MCYEELNSIYGGKGLNAKTISIIGGVIVFLIGILDGFINPNKCNN